MPGAKRARPSNGDVNPANNKAQRTEAAATAAGAGVGVGAGADPTILSSDASYRRKAFDEFANKRKACEQMIPIIGSLYRTDNVVTTLYGRSLVSMSAVDIVKAHTFGREKFHEAITESNTLRLLTALTHFDTPPMKFDVGRACVLLKDVLAKNNDKRLTSELADRVRAMPTSSLNTKPVDIVLYGFGRIGRLLARVLIEKTGTGSKLVLRAIVCRKKPDDLQKRFNLFVRDSVHGAFYGDVRVDETNNTLIANGNIIQLVYASNPAEVDYTKYGINDAIVIDNTGIWRNKAGLGQHLGCPGVRKVVLTSPGSKLTTIVAGINDDRVSEDVDIYSAASCTTNAIVPVLKCVEEKFGITSGHLETIHSYTNDQNLIDNYHKKNRRGRSAALNMVLTSTGAATAVAESLPSLAGKLTGNAVRVPTPCVSLAILILDLAADVTAKELNEYLLQESVYGKYHHQLGFSSNEDAVSSDFVGSRSAGVVDAPNTLVSGKRANIYLWYDNEFGYSCQVIRLVQRIAGVNFSTFPSVGTTA